MIKQKVAVSLVFLILAADPEIFAQNNRTNTRGTIGWYNNFLSLRIDKKWGLHGEYQWRRDNFIANWQQSLLRVGVNHQLTPNILLRAGYAWAETFPYGEIPINGFGKDFTEHRVYEMAQLSHKEGSAEFSHRFMLEQRFVGRYSSASQTREDDFVYLNRMRYMVRAQTPLRGKSIADKTPFAAIYNEVLVGFGKNVNANVFDQNRLGLLLGYRFSNTVRVEVGYLNQIVQFGRLINGKNVFQNNNGLIVNTNINLGL